MTHGSLVDSIIMEVESFLGKAHHMTLSLSSRPLDDEEREVYERRLKSLIVEGMPSTWLKSLSRKRLSKFDSLMMLVRARIGEYGVDEERGLRSRLTSVALKSIEDARVEYLVASPSIDEDKIVSMGFMGNDWQSRLWSDKFNLYWNVRECVLRSLALSHGAIRMREEIERIVLRSKHAMERLERTESSRVRNACVIKVLSKARIREYSIEVKGDCPLCKLYEGSVFKTKDAMQGLNAPPFHPGCACLVRGVV